MQIMPGTSNDQNPRLKRYIIIIALFWTVAVTGSLGWNIVQVKRSTIEVARNEARVAHAKDVIYRRWSAMNGGVYVPVTEHTPVNPYLMHPERDIKTPSGRLLTLVNPAYMTRQVYKMVDNEFGIQAHITSLKPLRPENAPDSWEIDALKAFERGETEISSLEMVNGKESFRLMRPLITEKACLKCHRTQGYKKGDIRGGISVSIPMKPLWSIAHKQKRILFAAHSVLWLLGMGGIAFGTVRLTKSDQKQREMQKEKEKLQTRIRQAQKMEAVGTLAGGVAHDLNNLLQPIVLNTELLLLDHPQESPRYKRLKDIETASYKASDLISQLLSFSRKEESRPCPIDLNQEIKNAGKLLDGIIPEKIRVEFQLADNLRKINAGRNQIEQILINLATNASEAMPEGGKLTITTENLRLDEQPGKKPVELKAGDYALLTVADTGCGIESKTLEHIYEPFFSTKKLSEGAGLGLSTVYGIVQSHHGFIDCRSTPGQGSSFFIYWPVPEIKTERRKKRREPAKGGLETIMLVDDEESILEICQQILTDFGYRVILAPDCEKALEIYRRENIDLVVLDMILPGMGGKQGMEAILKINNQAKVIIASGFSPEESPEKLMEAGAKCFIKKPYKMNTLLKTIREVLDEIPE